MIPNNRRGGPNREDAEMIAIEALAFLADEPSRLARFLAETGMAADTLIRHASSPRTMQAILDHLMSDESLLLVFAAEKSRRPEEIAAAQSILSGPTREE